MVYFFRRARRTRIDPLSSVNAPIAVVALISGTVSITPAMATTDVPAIANSSPTSFFMFPPRISKKLTILVAAIVVPLAKFLKTQGDPAVYENVDEGNREIECPFCPLFGTEIGA